MRSLIRNCDSRNEEWPTEKQKTCGVSGPCRARERRTRVSKNRPYPTPARVAGAHADKISALTLGTTITILSIRAQPALRRRPISVWAATGVSGAVAGSV
jgi:hypothetical protein